MQTHLAQLDAADASATFMRITIREADAFLVNPTMKSVFSSQFSGVAPIVIGGQRKDKLGSAASERWKQAGRSEANPSLDAGLREVIESTASAICPEIELHDEPSRLLRAGGQAGQRPLGAILAIEKARDIQPLNYSGNQDTT
ncbi:unnamed protein product, partial [Prorocentrum cordatum]